MFLNSYGKFPLLIFSTNQAEAEIAASTVTRLSYKMSDKRDYDSTRPKILKELFSVIGIGSYFLLREIR